MIRWKKRKNNATQHTLSFLRSVSIFAGLSDMQLWYIAQRMEHEHYGKGSFIVEEGTAGENCFFISDGSVKITRSSKEGRPVILAILHKSDFFGEMSMFDGEIRSASAVAQEDTKVFTLSRKEFISLVRDFSEISIQLLTDIAERIRKSDQHITSLTLNSSERRIGLCILRLAEEQGTIKDGTVTIKKFPFQRDIANIVGTSRETVNHILSRFEIDNLINRDGRHLTIKNYTEFFQRFD